MELRLPPQATLIDWAIKGLIAIIAAILLWVYILRPIVFGRTDNARERGGRIVAEEQAKAGDKIAGKTLDTVHERDVYREHTREIIERRSEEVNNAWSGESVGKGVDAAGAAALCELHDDLCRRDRRPAEVQPIR